MPVLCANPRCTNSVPRTQLGSSRPAALLLCNKCKSLLYSANVPAAGYIPSGALNAIAKLVLDRQAPLPEQINQALRYARGPRYPRGDWNDRPAYRISPLKYGTARKRLPHLLVGRARAPSANSLATSYVHYVLSTEIIGAGDPYGRYCAGGTYIARRSLAPPRGRRHEVLKGDAKSTRWKMPVKDFMILGTHALRAAERLDLKRTDSELKAFIVTAYLRGVEEGRFYPPVTVPYYAMAESWPGGHPFAHWIGPRADVPNRFHRKQRSQTGLIGGGWPDGLDPLSDLLRSAASSPAPSVAPIAPSTPDTSWLWQTKEPSHAQQEEAS